MCAPREDVRWRTKTFEEEFLGILKKHRIEYDPRYVFEQEIVE
jgi:putative transposase